MTNENSRPLLPLRNTVKVRDTPNVSEFDIPDLSAKARQTLARIRDFEEDGLSGRQMLKQLRTTYGVKISNKAFWETRRLAKSFRDSARKAKYSRNDRLIPATAYKHSGFGLTRARFQHIVKVSGRNNLGEVVKPKFITISSAGLVTKNQIYAGAEAVIENDKGRYDFVVSRGIHFSLEEMYQTV